MTITEKYVAELKNRLAIMKPRIDEIDLDKVKAIVEKYDQWIETLNDDDFDKKEYEAHLDIGSSIEQISWWLKLYKESEDIYAEYENARLINKELNYLKEFYPQFNMAKILKG